MINVILFRMTWSDHNPVKSLVTIATTSGLKSSNKLKSAQTSFLFMASFYDIYWNTNLGKYGITMFGKP